MKPVCKNCSHTWSWWDGFKQSARLQKYLICPYCHVKQYLTKGTNRLDFVVCYSALIIILTMIVRAETIMPAMTAAFVYFACYHTTFPFILRLSNKKEGLFQSSSHQ